MIDTKSTMRKVRTAAALAAVGLPTYRFSAEAAPLGLDVPGATKLREVLWLLLTEGVSCVCLRTEPASEEHLAANARSGWPPGPLPPRMPFFIFRDLDSFSFAPGSGFDDDLLRMEERASRGVRRALPWMLEGFDPSSVEQSFRHFLAAFALASSGPVRVAVQEAAGCSSWNATVAWDRQRDGEVSGVLDHRYGLVGEVSPRPGPSHREAISSGGTEARGVVPVARWHHPDRGRLRRAMRDHAVPGVWYECSMIDGDRLMFWDIAEDSTRTISPEWGMSHLRDVDLVQYHLRYPNP